MDRRSSLTQEQRIAAVVLFEKGAASRAVATSLEVPRDPIRRLHQRWRVRGRGVLVSKRATPAVYPFELKLDLVQRFLAGETLAELAEEGGLSSPVLLRRWVREYRAHDEDALRPKPKGRPAKSTVTGEETELDRLRREVEYLRAENAYLGKLRALMEEKRRTR